jgi:uncharacterized membrane protein
VVEHLEAGFKEVVALIQFCMEAIAAFCVLMGLASSVLVAVRNPVQVMASHFLLLRLRLGSWLALALEFQLGADIVSTTVAPTFEELGKLAAIALIRTFLNYFLNRELVQEEEREAQLRTLRNTLEPERYDPSNS